jgi:hypothetical protein
MLSCDGSSICLKRICLKRSAANGLSSAFSEGDRAIQVRTAVSLSAGVAPEDSATVGSQVDATEDAGVAGNLLNPGELVLRVVDALPGFAIIE